MSPVRRHPALRRWVGSLAVAVLLAACTTPARDDPGGAPRPDAAGDPGETDDPAEGARCEAAHDRTLRWVHAEPVEDLTEPAVDDRRLASWVRHGLHQGLYARTATGELVADLLVSDGRLEPAADGTVVVHHELREGLRFSDGTPITAETVRDTYELLADPDAARALGAVPGYERILPDGWELDGRRFSFTLDGPFSGWRQLFRRVLPTHVLPDLDAARDAFATLRVDGEPLPVSGPYVATSWQPGSELVLERDPDHHGANPARRDVDHHGAACFGTIELTLSDTPEAVAPAFTGGTADLAVGPATPAVAALPASSYPREVPSDGPVTQVVVDPRGPHLGDVQVREALATLLDRRAVVAEAHLPLLGADGPADGAGTVLLPPSPTRDPQTASGLGRGDVDAATLRLEDAGYVPDPSGTWVHPERGALTVGLETVVDDGVREDEGRLLASALADHGWEVRRRERPLDELLARWLPTAATTDGAAIEVSSGDEVAAVAVLALDVAPEPWAEAERYRSSAGPLGTAGLDELLDRCAASADASRCYLRIERSLVSVDGELPAMTAIPIGRRPYLAVRAGERIGSLPALSVAADAGPLTVVAGLLPAG
ncbi:hypothetical protein FTX61_11690 [Nitriliruptoraceae bacterium ZYF776]|nr:hypothetical protein [Profundirhabdus halotolerans]